MQYSFINSSQHAVCYIPMTWLLVTGNLYFQLLSPPASNDSAQINLTEYIYI